MSKLMEPLSDVQVRSALGNDTRIIKYGELKNYSMDELLPTVNSFFICLLEEEKNRGHWVAIMRLEDGLFYFNSYGIKYDRDISVIPRCIRRILGEDPARQFARLLDGRPCEWNRVKLQGEKTQTCGRWCCFTIIFCCFLGHSPAEFIQFIQEKSKSMNKSFDEVAASFVPL